MSLKIAIDDIWDESTAVKSRTVYRIWFKVGRRVSCACSEMRCLCAQ
jgi:hypothetical protein